MQDGLPLAAVDLGSNSFRLEIGRFDGGQLQRVQYLKEPIRQGNGLDSSGVLSRGAMQRGWDCLARFGERLRGFKPRQVRAVATQTLREAVNRDEFIGRGAELLGFPIDVISGPEEARLIYQGVSHLLPPSDERRLVVDIGGRSTELILGRKLVAKSVASFPVGSVAWNMKYFPEGRFTAAAFAQAEIAAKALLDEALQAYPRSAWDTAYGSSGTVGAVGVIAALLGAPPDTVTRETLYLVRERMIQARTIDALRLDGLKDDRKAVIGGGVSVLCAVFDLLEIDRMEVAQGALRQGALYDLLDRERPQTDLRAVTVASLAQRFGVDEAQSRRVSDVALRLYSMVEPGEDDPEHERRLRKLAWAARVHEIGCLVSHTDSHKHGAYILDNVDAPGFAMPELHRLSLLVLGQRGKLRKVEPALVDRTFAHMTLSLRLAVALCHARRDPDLTGLSLSVAAPGPGWIFQFPASWETRFPQSAHLLREEALCWQKTEWALDLRPVAAAVKGTRASAL